jgi:hypothetical protein
MPEERADTDAALGATLERLCGRPVLALDAVRGGGNNRLFRLATSDGDFAVKLDPAPDTVPRDRLGTEFGALEFLARMGVGTVPRPIARDSGAGVGIYEWIAGGPVEAPGGAEIDAALAFAATLKRLSAETDAAVLKPASEPCFAADDLTDQIERRLARLESVDDPGLQDYLANALIPRYQALRDAMAAAYAGHGWSTAAPLNETERTLSPSDFGFHNAIRRTDGTIAFIDFEYFGWDDPVRLVSDFVLHPGMALGADERRRYLAGTLALFGGTAFSERLGLLFPLVAVRWCLIILNEFLPDHWARRALAGSATDREAAKGRQLAKSEVLLASLDNRQGELRRAF